jgi:hypothetical protein
LFHVARSLKLASGLRRPLDDEPVRPKPSRRAPPDFKPDLEFAMLLAPDIDAREEAAKFMDHEFKNRHADWSATWRNWIRRGIKYGDYVRIPKAPEPVKPIWQ